MRIRILVFTFISIAATTARGAEIAPSSDSVPADSSQPIPDKAESGKLDAGTAPELGFWERDLMTGDWDGARTALSDAGTAFNATYIGETLANVSGGIRRGDVYDGRLELVADLDLEKIAGWTGATIHANAYQTHGRSLTPAFIGSGLAVSNIEAHRSTRLFTAWIQQNWFDDRLSIRVGQIAADDEFFVTQVGSSFMNGTFEAFPLAASNLPSGGSVYPLAAPGVRLLAKPAEDVQFLTAVFSGDPAGRHGGVDSQVADDSGTTFSLSGGVFVISELQYQVNQGKDAEGLPGVYKLGGWYHSGEFDDQRLDDSGSSLASPSSTGTPLRHHGNYAIYAVADQMLWREEGSDDHGLSFFVRAGGAPSDRNAIEFYADGGPSYKGLIPGRGDDVLGLAVGYAQVSSDASQLDRDTQTFSGMPSPTRDYELVPELTYLAAIAPWWTVQPDLQYFIHPGGHVANPSDPSGQSAIPNAFVISLRTIVKF